MMGEMGIIASSLLSSSSSSSSSLPVGRRQTRVDYMIYYCIVLINLTFYSICVRVVRSKMTQRRSTISTTATTRMQRFFPFVWWFLFAGQGLMSEQPAAVEGFLLTKATTTTSHRGPASSKPFWHSKTKTRRRIYATPSVTTLSVSSSSSSSSSSSTTASTTTTSSSSSNNNANTRVTLSRFLSNQVKEHPEFQDLQNILLALELSCKTISNLVNRAGLVYSIQNDFEEEEEEDEGGAGRDGKKKDPSESSSTTIVSSRSSTSRRRRQQANYSDGRYYSMKRLDKLSTNVLKNALKFTGTVQMIAPDAQMDNEVPQQHQPGVLVAYDENFVACLDPLDGSGNADASICTGTVFGVFARQKKNKEKKNNDIQQEESSSSSSEEGTAGSTNSKANNNNNNNNKNAKEETTIKDIHDEKDLLEAVLQPGRNMRAAGYCLYSSATVLVFTLANGVYGFTLDPQIQEFVLTHNNLTIPPRGTVYSCNEANSEGWNAPWKRYLRNLKLGQGETKTRYAHRYVGSMVGDIHRTLLYGGIFAYPSDSMEKPKGNLQLLYKSAPMAFVVHHAGGKAMDEEGQNLLDKKPKRIHQKSPCFMGSPQDMEELEGYLKNRVHEG